MRTTKKDKRFITSVSHVNSSLTIKIGSAALMAISLHIYIFLRVISYSHFHSHYGDSKRVNNHHTCHTHSPMASHFRDQQRHTHPQHTCRNLTHGIG